MEREYNSYRLGLTKKRADWLVNWLREVVRAGSVVARDMSQGLGRLGFAAIALEWERPFLGPLYAWSSAIQGKAGPMKLPVMLSVDELASDCLKVAIGYNTRCGHPGSYSPGLLY